MMIILVATIHVESNQHTHVVGLHVSVRELAVTISMFVVPV